MGLTEWLQKKTVQKNVRQVPNKFVEKTKEALHPQPKTMAQRRVEARKANRKERALYRTQSSMDTSFYRGVQPNGLGNVLWNYSNDPFGASMLFTRVVFRQSSHFVTNQLALC
jgi:hypothetical protein